MSKAVKRILIIVAVLLVVVLTAGIIAGNYMYNLALNPTSDKSMVYSASHNSVSGGSGEETNTRSQRYADAQAWFETSTTEDWHLESRDCLRLHATAVTDHPSSGLWAVLCHGYGGSGLQMIHSGKRFSDAGYNLLMPDARGLGESEGDYIGMGWPERLDIVDWISRILEDDPDAQIVLYGVSMGGATVMMVSGEDLPSNVKAIVEDCGYSSVWDEFAYQLKALFGLPSFPLLNISSVITQIRAGYSFTEASAVKQVAKSKTPMLFIHGSADTFVPTEMVYTVYEAATVPKQLLVVEGAAHGASASVAGESYWNTVWDFINPYVDTPAET